MFDRFNAWATALVLNAKDEKGQGATEYAMVIGFLIVGLTVGLGALGVGIDAFLDRVAAALGRLVP
jgi:Flp pilus assembly pilin Flp